MSRARRWIVSLFALFILGTPLLAAPRVELPLLFEPLPGNDGFAARAQGFRAAIAPSTARFAAAGSTPLALRFVGTQPRPDLRGSAPTGGKSHYIGGNDSQRWRRDVPHYRRVEVGGIYPGIDLVYYGTEGKLEYDFIVAPHSDPRRIRFLLDVEAPVRLTSTGRIKVDLAHGPAFLEAPVAYQLKDQGRELVPVSYARSRSGSYRFELGDYDPSRELIIDPVVVFSTYLGGLGLSDSAKAIAVDPLGNTYITGELPAPGAFPVTGGAFSTSQQGSVEIFAAKINAAGNTVLWATYLGGSGPDRVFGAAVDNLGHLYLTGETLGSTDFPTKDPLQGALADSTTGSDAFVTKFAPDGGSLVYSTFLGAVGFDRGHAIAVDAAGNAYVLGETEAAAFPITAGVVQDTLSGTQDAFIAKINPAGSALVWATFLGGSSLERVSAGVDAEMRGHLAIDAAGQVFVTGSTLSSDFPTTTGAFDESYNDTIGLPDVFVAKLDSAGANVLYATYLGGGTLDVGRGIAVDASGYAFVTGYTESADFPTTSNVLQPTRSTPPDAFVAKLSPDGSTLAYSTFLGGGSSEFGNAITVDASGRPVIAGWTSSTDFPTTAGAVSTTLSGTQDAFVTKLDSAAAGLIFSTFLGGGLADRADAIASNLADAVFVAGDTTSTDFPTMGPAQQDNAGGQDAFVTKLDIACEATAPELRSEAVDASAVGRAITIAIGEGCSWSISTEASWITITSATTFSGGGTATFTIEENATGLRRTATVIVAGFVFTYTQEATTQVFSDAAPGNFFFDAVNLLSERSITDGCAGDPPQFCPNDPIPRGQIAVFLVRGILGTDDFSFPATPFFTDVPATHQFFKWIQKLRELGITTGCAAELYCPDALVTRGQMAVFIIRARFGSTVPFGFPTSPLFDDVAADHVFFAWIQELRELEITTGCAAAFYCPGDSVTRGQIAVFVMRGLFDLLLPADRARIATLSQTSAQAGTGVSLTITGANTSFVQGVSVVRAGPGITVGAANITGNQTLTVLLTISSAAATGPRSITVTTGTEDVTLPNGFTIDSP